MATEPNFTLLIRAGFDISFKPAGRALCSLEGEFEPGAVDELLKLLDMISSHLREKIADAKEQGTKYAS